jgi:hypothetical protein
MNAKTLIDSTPTHNFEFSKFWKSNSSQVNSFNNFDRGDKVLGVTSFNCPKLSFAPRTTRSFVGEKENKHPSGYNNLLPSYTPTNDYLKQININKVKNTATEKADVFRNLGIQFL